MRVNLLAGLAAIVLFVAYFAPLVLKLRDVPLGVVVVTGVTLVVADFLESLRD